MRGFVKSLSVVATLSVITSGAQAAIVTEHFNFSQWSIVADDVTAITFTEFPSFTVITDQYAHLGATFADGNDFTFSSTSFPQDGFGLAGSDSDSITVQFDAPRSTIGVHYPGAMFIELYNQGTLFYTSINYDPALFGPFVGLASTIPFDTVVIGSWATFGQAFIDNLYFGPPVPGPGGAAVMGLAILSFARRRRC